MGSLNGDVMVMRNGRSTSQVSIYNYPEHLNPFYEDDQHKRLRFWKINKKDNEGRRNSFSIGNLKDMWAFKSFRMKKKSSTLGINKTSESPPTLRRDFALNNGWNSIDHRLRGTNVTSLNGDNFQRNAIYRSSLQTLTTSNADRIGLNRNDGYRSTIQVTRSNPRYQPQTPQVMGVSQNRRSSQSSMVSTNPFESDDDENEDINSSGIRSVNGGSTTTLTSRTPRKKRRAPAPPTPVHRSNAELLPTIVIESSHDSTNDELRIKEDIDIVNLTAEIQSFVETTNNDDVDVKITEKPKDNILDNRENIQEKKQNNTNSKVANPVTLEEFKSNEITSTLENSTDIKQNSKDVFNKTTEEKPSSTTHKANDKNSSEFVSVTTTTKTIESSATSEANIPLKQQSHSVNAIENKTNESKEIKANGAIPKKPNKITDTSSSADQHIIDDALHIEETHIESMQQKPVPLKRQTKPEPEVGNVECIHVHVESPRATPRKDSLKSGVSSFKANELHEDTETITTKTPFVLTSPPTHKKNIQPQVDNTSAIKETVKIIKLSKENEPISELNISEERINAKPQILIKPTLSPKPIPKELHIKTHGFAEIHKPMRSKYSSNQTVVATRSSRDESVSPPTLPLENVKEDEKEKKINNSAFTQIEAKGMKSEERKESQLKIIENKSNENQHLEVDSETLVKPVKDELDQLYRPKPASHMEWKRSTLAPLEPNIPPEKRKSVKDIIESINRSQRLLNAAANKDFTTLSNTTTIIPSSDGSVANSTQTTKTVGSIPNNIKNNFNEGLRIVDESHMANEMDQTVENATNGAAGPSLSLSPSPSPSNYSNEVADAQKLNNSEIFQKCKVKKEVYDYRESSPISSNLDWNPLPKPKRTKSGQE